MEQKFLDLVKAMGPSRPDSALIAIGN